MARGPFRRPTFPVYVVPPDRWEGYVGPVGHGSRAGRIDRVDVGYDDDPPSPNRGFVVVSQHAIRPNPEPPIRPGDVGRWRTSPRPDGVTRDVVGRFSPGAEEAAPVNADPSRITAITTVEVAGWDVETIRREYRRFPSLRTLRIRLPRVLVTVLGWELSFEELEAQARHLTRLEPGSDLAGALDEAAARWHRRFEEVPG